MKERYPDALKDRFGIEEIKDYTETLGMIATKRGLLVSNGQYDLLKAEALLLKEFKDGLLGRMTLEWL